MAEWFIWEAKEGWLTLEDFRRVFVRWGDEVLAIEGKTVRFIDHLPKTVH